MKEEDFKRSLRDMIADCSNRQGERQGAAFTELMKLSRAHGVEELAREEMQVFCKENGLPPMWELPEKFEGTKPLPPFPLECLPELLREYLRAVCESVQVKPEMAVLPLLSVLSLCVQGKAKIQFPASDHTEPLNLYTLTVAPPGERKTGTLDKFMKPVDDFQRRYNKLHRAELEAHRTRKELLMQRKNNAIKQGDDKEAEKAARELSEFEDMSELCLTVKDVTPEGLAQALITHNERMGVVDCEGTLFDVLSGIYSKGKVANIGIVLESYDGSPYPITRAGKENIILSSPLLTMCLMTQPEHCITTLRNKQFQGRGFIQRFLFAFPDSMAGYQSFISKNISPELSRRYAELIEILLVIPYPKTPDECPVLECDAGAIFFFEKYHEHTQEAMRTGGELESIKEWCSKQFARAVRIAGILHMAQHKEKSADVLVSADTAKTAIAIARWSEAQALRALSGECGESPTERAAKQILEKLRKIGEAEVTRSELTRSLRALQGSEFDEPLELLEAMRCVEIEMKPSAKGRGRQIIRVNPYLL